MSKTDIGIDLGTANTVITLGKKGVVLSEPSALRRPDDTVHDPGVYSPGHRTSAHQATHHYLCAVLYHGRGKACCSRGSHERRLPKGVSH